MSEFWQELARHLERGASVFLAVVAAHTPGSPGTTGAKMLVLADGEQHGTIGGGPMELALCVRARDALATRWFASRIQTLHHRRAGDGERSGMICSGSQTNVLYLALPERDGAVVGRAAESSDGTLVLAPGGLTFDPAPADLALPPCRLVRAPSGAWRYEEQRLNRRRLAIVGGGHCGRALAGVMQQVGDHVVILDVRSDLPTGDCCAARVVADYGVIGGLIEHPEITPVVVMTPGYLSDVEALRGLVGRPFPFVGVMGSAAKVAEIKRALRAAGIAPAWIEALRAPVGLAIGSHTPAEIAVSVAAQLLRERSL